ncbi:MAG: hypothetical protein ACJ705_05470, partial [Nitrososphaeraceae archaeon]
FSLGVLTFDVPAKVELSLLVVLVLVLVEDAILESDTNKIVSSNSPINTLLIFCTMAHTNY